MVRSLSQQLSPPPENENAPAHIPVMLNEILQALQPQDGDAYIDGTFGMGGYTSAILDRANCNVIAIDRDPEAIARGQTLKKKYADRLTLLQGCFGDIESLLLANDIHKVDGLVLDLGVSSPQIDTAERGFSFQKNGPLDMRMGTKGPSAADIVNHAKEEELSDIIFHYGEERAARKIARAIVKSRALKKITTTRELTEIIHSVLPMHGGMKTDTATRSFQALRIQVNDELGEIDRVLQASLRILKSGGRLVVVSFHSLEDRKIKEFFKQQSGTAPAVSRHMPQPERQAPAALRLLTGSAIKCSEEESAKNPRARSAKLRAAIRTEAA